MRQLLKYLSAVLAILLIAAFLPLRGFAITGNITIGPSAGQFDQGGQYTVYIAVNGSEAYSFQGNISVSGGGTFAGADGGLQSAGGTLIIVPDSTNGAAAGNITVKVSGDQPVTISVSGTMLSVETGAQIPVSGSVTIPVRSTAQQQADAAEAERIRREQEAAMEAARRSQEEEAARQASIQASIDAYNASVDESIRLEQESIQQSEAEEEAKRQSSILESESIAESERMESVSVQESIEESERQSSRAESMHERSVSESIAAVEATRAYLLNGSWYVPYDYQTRRFKHFQFALPDTEVTVPEEYYRTELVVNEQKVLAFRAPGMDEDVYLVYGIENEQTVPRLYFYNTDTEALFPYDSIYGEVRESKTEVQTLDISLPEEKPVEAANLPKRKIPGVLVFLVGFVCLLLGAAAALLTLNLVMEKRAAEGIEPAVDEAFLRTPGPARETEPQNFPEDFEETEDSESVSEEEADDAETEDEDADQTE